MALKNKLAPVYFQYDILDTEMPECFFDKSAKTQMFFYELNDVEGNIDVDNLFIDEESTTIQQFGMKFYGKIDVWMSNNYSKMIQPFHSDSLSKTLAFQTELRFFVTEKPIFEKVKSNFCILTFQPLNRTSSKGIPIYIVKELNEFKDRQKIRYAEFKALQLNSNLIKSSQNWEFLVQDNLKRKVKQVKITVPFYTFLGQITFKCRRENSPFAKEEMWDYKISRITHPFRTLEPICVNFVQNDDKLLLQLPSWDRLGKAFEWLAEPNWLVWESHYGPVSDQNRIEGSSGSAGYSYWIGTCDGLADTYCSGKTEDQADNINNSLKAYMWTTTNINAHVSIWNCYYMGKTFPTFNYTMIENFLKNNNNVYNYNWQGGFGGHKVGSRFSTFELNTLNDSNFLLEGSTKDLNEISNPVWCLAGSIDYKHVFKLWKQIKNDRHGYSKLYNDEMKLPWGLMNKDTIKKRIAKCKDYKTFENIEITFDLDVNKGVYLNELDIIMLYGETIKITIYDEIGLISTYDYYSSFYRLGETEIKTTIRFN